VKKLNSLKKEEQSTNKNENSSKEETISTEEKKLAQKTANDCSLTVFVLNVPFDATETDVKKCFGKYGQVARAYLTPDNSGSGNPHRGTAFVRFVYPSGLEKTLKAENALRDKVRLLGGHDSHQTKNALEGLGIILKGRRLIVKKCEPKEKAAELNKKSRKEIRQAERNRFSHLLKMGDLDESSTEFKNLTKQEQMLRKSNAKNKKFKMNDPNFVINPCRIIVRNLPVGVETADLRKKIIEGCGNQSKENDDNVVDKNKPFSLQSVRIMKSTERKLQTGERRSLGFAFVEFSEHEDALNTLKWLNNREGVFSKKPMVEFAFDDKRALRQQEKAKALKEQKQENENWEDDDGEKNEKKKESTKKEVEAPVGHTIMEIAKNNDIEQIEALCGGSKACATCHIVLPSSNLQWLFIVCNSNLNMFLIKSILTEKKQ